LNLGTHNKEQIVPHFIDDTRYSVLLDALRAAALSTDWRSAMAEALACADVLPECCRGDFAGDDVEAA
jgi:hypothetical protein